MTVLTDLTEFHPVLQERLRAARATVTPLATATTNDKNLGLYAIADALIENSASIIAANEQDIARGKENGLAEALFDRLMLNDSRIADLAEAVRDIAKLPDPVGEVLQGKALPNGLKLTQVRVPFGVVGAIYEARPNVTVDIAALALKSGNAALLRGGAAAEKSNTELVRVIQEALAGSGLPAESVQSIDELGREGASQMMKARGWVDLLIPRGSAGLIHSVVNDSTVPVIETGDGVVHIFIDETAKLDGLNELVVNAKVQRPSVCNAVETLLLHQNIATKVLPNLAETLVAEGVQLVGDDRAQGISNNIAAASDEDWDAEYLELKLAIRIVDTIDDALEHISAHSTGHTDTILTGDLVNAERFLNQVDSAVVMVNASTRFTDGGEFGFGAEVGISTQKLHARGPMGLSELTSSKWLVRGEGQIRG